MKRKEIDNYLERQEKRQITLKTWLRNDITPKLEKCVMCYKTDFTQHQKICVDCMISYHEVNVSIHSLNKMKNFCLMCGSESKKIFLDSNCCNSCLNGMIEK